MDLNTILLVAAALTPAIALCIYVFKKDRVEKEPIGLLLWLAALGAGICYPAAKLEQVMEFVIDAVFAPFATEADGTLYLGDFLYKVYNFCTNFFGIALVEEGLKFLVLVLATRNNENFNSLFDGVIYAVFVSLGFAALENVMYVLEYGWATAAARAIFAVPGHMFDAVLMGYGYSYWHMVRSAARVEKNLIAADVIAEDTDRFCPSKFLVWSLIVPVLAHGLYDYCCTSDSSLSTAVLYVFVAFLYFHCFGKIRKMSKLDGVDGTYALIILVAKYPGLAEVFRNMTNQEGVPMVESSDLSALELAAREFRMEHFV